jgi:hypothetical protein
MTKKKRRQFLLQLTHGEKKYISSKNSPVSSRYKAKQLSLGWKGADIVLMPLPCGSASRTQLAPCPAGYLIRQVQFQPPDSPPPP